MEFIQAYNMEREGRTLKGSVKKDHCVGICKDFALLCCGFFHRMDKTKSVPKFEI